MSDERIMAADEPSAGQWADGLSVDWPVLFDWIELSDLLIMLHITKNTLKVFALPFQNERHPARTAASLP